ncbi:hypothetical protein Q31a_50380 [Aureliella helgolandensis]|uniref:MarR family protein n=1 Tax=Aureliella helgolandensis TaxID=2527968 RepID=A0A518GDI6_9BACT|nr:hypothetical protein Q31a_50380 [Aureliella helgolandensis]
MIGRAQLRSNPQPTLFDRGDAARAAQVDALRKSREYHCERRDTAYSAFAAAGRDGLTRHELSQTMQCQQSSICSVVLAMLRDGELVELRSRRRSTAGGSGCILVLSSYEEIARHAG